MLESQALSLRDLTVICLDGLCRDPFEGVPNYFVKKILKMPWMDDYFRSQGSLLAPSRRLVVLPNVRRMAISGNLSDAFWENLMVNGEMAEIVQEEFEEPEEEVEMRRGRVQRYRYSGKVTMESCKMLGAILLGWAILVIVVVGYRWWTKNKPKN